MIRLNTRMKKVLDKINSNKKSGGISIDFDSYKKLLLPEFRELEGCILINMLPNQVPKRINIEAILSMFGDRTGYEASRNELRINDYLDVPKNKECYLVEVALQLLEVWGLKLKAKFPDYKFCFIISYNDGYVTIRFHRIRQNETSWLDDDLEGYEEESILTKVI